MAEEKRGSGRADSRKKEESAKETPPEAKDVRKPSRKAGGRPAEEGRAETGSGSSERTARAPEGGRLGPDETSGEAAPQNTRGRTESGAETAEETSGKERAGRGEEELSEEEFRRYLEESLERVTVDDVVLTLMNHLASLGYLKMGLPESVNLKYRDLQQALLAVDVLEAMIRGAEGKIAEEKLRPFRGTLANLQLNYVQLKRRLG